MNNAALLAGSEVAVRRSQGGIGDAGHWTHKKPIPYVLPVASQADVDWDPCLVAQYVPDVEEEEEEDFHVTPPAEHRGRFVRAGDSYAVCRPGSRWRRWPLGHVSDVYKVVSHRRTVNEILEAAPDMVEPFEMPLMSGHGYRVVHQFSVTHMQARTVAGKRVSSLLAIVHDHTGLHAMKDKMVVMFGDRPLGSIVGSRGLHVGGNPSVWRGDIAGQVERSVLAQGALIDMIEAASKHPLSPADKAVLDALKIKGKGKDGFQEGTTLLDAVLSFMDGRSERITWGVYERRFTDVIIVAMVRVLGRSQFGRPLDEALRTKKYSR